MTAVIPLPCCLEWEERPGVFQRLEERLELPPDPCSVADALVDRFLAELDELGIARIDLRVPMGALDEPPFWERDFHLDLAGQELVAREFLPFLESWLGRSAGGWDPTAGEVTPAGPTAFPALPFPGGR